MEPLFEQKNAELKEAATHIIVDRMGQGKRTTKKFRAKGAGLLLLDTRSSVTLIACPALLSDSRN